MAAGTWTMTRHAQRRRKQVKLTEHAIADILDDPEITYPDLKYGTGCWLALKGAFAVVFHPEDHAVITVICNTHEHVERVAC